MSSLGAPLIPIYSNVTLMTLISVACDCFLAIEIIAMSLPADIITYLSERISQAPKEG